MIQLELKGTKRIYTQDNSFLNLHYYLVQEFYDSNPIYGIQIQSYWNNDFRSIHSEIIPHISYSLDFVLQLIRLCIRHLVTPTDLFSSCDVLMDTLTE